MSGLVLVAYSLPEQKFAKVWFSLLALSLLKSCRRIRFVEAFLQESLNIESNMIDFMPPVPLRDYLTVRKVTNDSSFHDIFLTFRGLDSIALVLQYFKLSTQDSVLLPGYQCDTVSADFAGNWKLIYCDINNDFSIDANAVEGIFSKNRVRLFFIPAWASKER